MQLFSILLIIRIVYWPLNQHISTTSCHSKPLWMFFFSGIQNKKNVSVFNQNELSPVFLDTIDFHCMDKTVETFFNISSFVFHRIVILGFKNDTGIFFFFWNNLPQRRPLCLLPRMTESTWCTNLSNLPFICPNKWSPIFLGLHHLIHRMHFCKLMSTTKLDYWRNSLLNKGLLSD